MRRAIPQFIGARVRRREDPALLTGEGRYVADIPLEAAAHMAIVRSPHAHAHIRGIDTRAAAARTGVLAIVTAEDVHPHIAKPFPVDTGLSGGRFTELWIPARFPLAARRVRYVGDPVAAIVAETPYHAADALEAVAVDYDPLPVLTDPEAAMHEDAPLIHEACARNRGFVWKVENGDVDGAFTLAEKIVEVRFRIQRLIPNAMEPRAVAACYDAATERFTLWSTTQTPHLVQEDLAESLGVAREQVRVIAPEVGGGFGAKSNLYDEEILAPFLARRLGRPVRWVASRREDFVATSHGRDQMNVLRLASDARGRVQALDLVVLADCGAYYTRATAGVPPLTGVMMTGSYDIPNARAEVVGIFTNKVPMEPYRGAGRPEAAYMIERGMDVLARELGLDPAEVRRRNFIPPDSFPYTTASGIEYDSGDYGKALELALEKVGYHRWRKEQKRRREKGGKPIGIGLSSYVEICGFGPWEAGTVKVDSNGKVTVLTGTSPHGQGHETSWAQIAADVLQVPLKSIEVRHGDTDVVPRGIGTFGSRSAPVGGAAVYRSAEIVREHAKRIAAHLLEAATVDIRLSDGKFQVVGVPRRAVSWKEVAAADRDPDLPEDLRGTLSAETEFEPEGETYPFGTHVAVVEIEPETGETRILRYVAVDDCGKVINPLLVEGQVHGGIAQGVAQALWERAVYDESGNLVTGSLMDYACPRADFFPHFETFRTETPTPLNAMGVKGVGEAATIGSTPAVVNAVVDALSPYGVRHVDTPLTPETIWRLLGRRKDASS